MEMENGKDWFNMKKIISIVLLFSAICSAVFINGISSSAFLGKAAEVIASDVNLIKTGLIGQKICFNDSDFKSALALSNFDSITITEIPISNEGTLLIGGRRVSKGRVIKRKNLSSLVFIPASNAVTECRFKFTIDGYAGGAEIVCIMKFIDKINYAPEAIGDSIGTAGVITQESISAWGNLEAQDPEGDKIEFIIVSYPKRGALTLTDNETGRYCYTPIDGYTGKDKFTFVVRDEYGNYSEPITVNVRVSERMCDTVYRDMEEREEYNAAVAVTAMGIMNGRQVGDDLYFDPDVTVNRAEFVAMVMKCCGVNADSTLTHTYFDDDDDITQALKGYIATAQRIGLVSGDFKNGKLLFAPNEEITRYEAARIMAELIAGENEGEESVFATEEDIPIWARAGVYAMCSLGVFNESDASSLSEKITRADVAEYLYRIMKMN